jgi:hypothetical protein
MGSSAAVLLLRLQARRVTVDCYRATRDYVKIAVVCILPQLGVGKKTDDRRPKQKIPRPNPKRSRPKWLIKKLGRNFYRPNLVWSIRSFLPSNRIDRTNWILCETVPIFRIVWCAWDVVFLNVDQTSLGLLHFCLDCSTFIPANW